MATRIDPELYGDSPIFRQMLREREGRWPGIPPEQWGLPEVQLHPATIPTGAAPIALQAMYRVYPVPSRSASMVRPYVTAQPLLPAPDDTAPTSIPPFND